MAAHPDARRKDDLEQIARRAMQKYGFRPDFSADALRELEMALGLTTRSYLYHIRFVPEIGVIIA